MRIDNSSLLNQLNNDEKLLINKIIDMIEISQTRYQPVFSFFLDERQQMISKAVLQKEHIENFEFFGGYESAKRKVLCVYPEYVIPDKSDYPFTAVTIKHRIVDKISHRDILGSLMGLFIKRETLGDILVTGGEEDFVFVYNSVLPVVMDELIKVGSKGISCSVGFDESKVPVDKYTQISGFVSSLRIDSILSVALKVSREKAANIVNSIGVDINYVNITSKSEMIEEGDIFSVKGYGKFFLSQINGTSKKGRIHITINKYI